MRNGKKFEIIYTILAGITYTAVFAIVVMVLATKSC